MTQKPRNADYTKEYNRKAVLRILRRQAMSRAELARATGLTRAAASLIVEELLNAGVVAELAPQSAGRGRSATPLVLRPDSYYALAVDLARKGCTVGLCDIGGNLLQCRELPEQGDMMDAITGALASLLETVDKSKVLGIGISAPGPLDCESGRILNPPRFERWHGVDIGKRLSSALGLPAYLEHDVCAMALHQQNTGCSRNFMLLFIDIGIGAAIVSDGRLCECGNRGCLETYASIPVLLEGSGFRDWFDLVNHADEPEARRLLDQEAVYLSAGLINLLNLIPVDSIYLAGDICCRHELLAERLRREIGGKALYRDRNETRIFPVRDTPNMGILSAAEVVFSRFFTV